MDGRVIEEMQSGRGRMTIIIIIATDCCNYSDYEYDGERVALLFVVAAGVVDGDVWVPRWEDKGERKLDHLYIQYSSK